MSSLVQDGVRRNPGGSSVPIKMTLLDGPTCQDVGRIDITYLGPDDLQAV